MSRPWLTALSGATAIFPRPSQVSTSPIASTGCGRRAGPWGVSAEEHGVSARSRRRFQPLHSLSLTLRNRSEMGKVEH